MKVTSDNVYAVKSFTNADQKTLGTKDCLYITQKYNKFPLYYTKLQYTRYSASIQACDKALGVWNSFQTS